MESPDTADVLVLAGDVTGRNKVDWINEQADRYENIVYVLGNHEHYKQYIEGTIAKTRKNLADNVHLLEKETVVLNGVSFHGCTLWADFDKKNPMTMEAADCRSVYDKGINDFRLIRHKNGSMRWSPLAAYNDHMACREWLASVVKKGDVVITHHAPCSLSVGSNFYNDSLRGAYASDLTDIMFDCEPSHWLHGHVHSTSNYQIGQTQVLCNPRGYVGHHINPEFDINAEFVR